jgi:hypothetical protein
VARRDHRDGRDLSPNRRARSWRSKCRTSARR